MKHVLKALALLPFLILPAHAIPHQKSTPQVYRIIYFIGTCKLEYVIIYTRTKYSQEAEQLSEINGTKQDFIDFYRPQETYDGTECV